MTRTAIIAVHGVGSPPRFDTARGIADLLTQYGCAAATCSYPSFREQLIKIPTSPLIIPRAAGGKAAQPQDETPSFLTRLASFRPRDRDRTTFDDDDVASATDLDIAFMRDQLVGYEKASKHEPYNTIEIIGGRVHEEAGQRIEDEVRIYEMYWADLSRVGSGLLRVVGAIYQLVIHIAHLGRKTLDLGSAAAARRPKAENEVLLWKRVSFWHAWALRLFTIAVPVFTLLLLGCVILFIPDAITPRRRLLYGVVMVELVLLIAIGVRSYFRERATHAAKRLVAYIVTFAVLGVAVILFSEKLGGNALGGTVLNIATAGLVLLAYLAIVNSYDLVAPAALPWGMTGLVVVTAGMIVWGPRFVRIAGPDVGEGLRYAALAGFQFSYLMLMGVWLLIWACALMTMLFNLRLRLALRHATIEPFETRERAKRAMWTAKVTLALSLFGLLITSLVGYESVNVLAWKIHGNPTTAASTNPDSANGFNIFPTVRKGGSLPLITNALRPDTVGTAEARMAPTMACPRQDVLYDPALCAKTFFDVLIAESGTLGLPLALLAAAISVLLISWFIILVAVTSMRVPKSESLYARNVGHWVTDGFIWVHTAGSILVIGLAIALSVGLAAAGWKLWTGQPPTFLPGLGTQQTSDLLVTLALAVLASSATLVAARARVELLASRARPAIGILLDVDNYLRESPANGTPRARIAERFGSLLRHVVERKDAEGRPYFDRVIVVAHSQGTVISADLLRFLTLAEVASPDLSNTDVRLLTMGCPLRQLYAAHFPHLYDWIDHTDDYGDGSNPDDDKAAIARGFACQPLVPAAAGITPTLNELSPSPSWLRVRQWVNLFTAGDYVGRPLWQNDNSPNVWKFDPHDRPTSGIGRRERCLGDGTHTRYWTSLEVAEEIDDLINA